MSLWVVVAFLCILLVLFKLVCWLYIEWHVLPFRVLIFFLWLVQKSMDWPKWIGEPVRALVVKILMALGAKKAEK